MWDLHFPTRDRISVPCVARQILNHWFTREVPYFWGFFLIFIFIVKYIKLPATYMQFIFFNLFFIEGKLLYKILLFSVKPLHESAIGTHISPPFRTSLPSSAPSKPSRLIQSPCLSFLSHTTNSLVFKIAIYFPYGNVSFHVTLYTSHPLLPSPHVHKSILYVCLSIAAL